MRSDIHERVRTYMDVVLNAELKNIMMKKDNLEKEYYDLIAKFNEEHHRVMYHLTTSELLSLVYRFFDANAEP